MSKPIRGLIKFVLGSFVLIVGLIKLITWCFSIACSLKVAIGIWLVVIVAALAVPTLAIILITLFDCLH